MMVLQDGEMDELPNLQRDASLQVVGSEVTGEQIENQNTNFYISAVWFINLQPNKIQWTSISQMVYWWHTYIALSSVQLLFSALK